MADEPDEDGWWASTFSDWAQTPPYVKRQLRWFGYSAVAVAIISAGLFVGWPRLGRGWGFLIPAILFVPQAVAMVMVWRFSYRLRRQFNESKGCLCTQCGHDVSGLGSIGTCPECGGAFDIERDRARWGL
jgi:hypothetical protein